MMEEEERRAELAEWSQPVTVHLCEDDADESEDAPPFSHAEDAFRRDLYSFAWRECEARIQAILARHHSKAIAEIVDFIFDAREEPRAVIDLPISKAVPTALVVGADEATSRVLASALIKPDVKGKGKQKALVARVDSREAPTAKAAMRCIISRVIASGTHGPPPAKVTGKKPSMLAPDDMMVLKTWYQQTYAKSTSSPVIAVFLDDFEGLSPRVAADVFYILSLYRRELPFCLVLGISTSVEVIQRNLFRSSLLYIRHSIFNLESGTEVFTTLMEGLFLFPNQLPLSIGADVYALLRDSFEDLNRSIDAVVSKLQYAYLQHFLASEYSAFSLALYEVDEEEEEQVPEVPKSLTRLALLSCPSAMEPDSLPTRSRQALQAAIDSPEKLVRLVHDSLVERETRQRKRAIAWELFSLLEDAWPQGRMSRADRVEGYFDGLLTEEVERLCRNLKSTSQDVLRTFLDGIVEGRKGDKHDERFKAWLEELDDKLGSLAAGTQLRNGNMLGSEAVTKEDKWFTQTVKEVAALAESIIKDGLVDDSAVRFHEMWTFSHAEALRDAFHPTITGSLARDNGEVFERLQDAGKLVNLADWYQSLSKKNKDVALFVREVSALNWQGFVGPTKRKTEHVARLYW